VGGGLLIACSWRDRAEDKKYAGRSCIETIFPAIVGETFGVGKWLGVCSDVMGS